MITALDLGTGTVQIADALNSGAEGIQSVPGRGTRTLSVFADARLFVDC